MAILHDQGGGQWGSLPPPPDQYAIGVPSPHLSFGYNPLTVQPPEDPAEWPAANATNWYFVNNETGNDDNGNGCPNAPRLSIPVGTLPAGTIIVVERTATPYTTGLPRYELTMQGTQADPCWFIGRNGLPEFDEEIRVIGCTHTIFSGLRSVRVAGGSWTLNNSQQSSYVTLRNCEFQGDQTNQGFGSVIGMAGPSGNKSHHIVIYNNHIWEYGDITDSADTPENDLHGCKPSVNITDMWFIGNHAHHLGGDSIQVADATTPASEVCERIYIAKNDMHDNFENAVDIKHSDDIIISQNKMYNFNRQFGSLDTLTALIIHNNAERVWVLFNEVYDSASGLQCTGGDSIHFIGNLIHDINPLISWDETSSYGLCFGAHMRSTPNGTIAWNTFVNYDRGTILIGTQNIEHVGNLYYNRLDVRGSEIRMSSSSGHASLTTDNNLYYPIIESEAFDRNNTIEDLAGWQTTTGKETNSLLSDPQLTAYVPVSGSPAEGAGVAPAAIATFQTLYGISIDLDYLSNARAANPTIGAYEAA